MIQSGAAHELASGHHMPVVCDGSSRVFVVIGTVIIVLAIVNLVGTVADGRATRIASAAVRSVLLEGPAALSPDPVFASAASGNVCALHKRTKSLVVCVPVPPGDVAADHPVLLFV